MLEAAVEYVDFSPSYCLPDIARHCAPSMKLPITAGTEILLLRGGEQRGSREWGNEDDGPAGCENQGQDSANMPLSMIFHEDPASRDRVTG